MCTELYYKTVFKTKAIKEKFPCTIHVCIKILKEGSFDNQHYKNISTIQTYWLICLGVCVFKNSLIKLSFEKPKPI